MTLDRFSHQPTPAEEDPVVHKFLGTLPRPEPHTPLETRVLKRVWRPLPRSVRERWARALGSWQAKMFLGLMAAGAFVWQAAVVGVAMRFPNETRDALTTATREVLPRAVNEGVRLVDVGVSTAQAWLAGYAVWLFGALIVTIISAIGLVLVMRSGRMTHVWQ